VLLISEAMFIVRKFNESDLIVQLTYFALKLIIDKNANLLTSNVACFWPVLQKQFFSNSEEEVEAKTVFLQQQVLLYSKYVFSKWNSGMCSFLKGQSHEKVGEIRA
jgi:hypothetical protein